MAIDVRFLLEVWRQGKSKPERVMVLPPVSHYALTLRPATVREWTLGTYPIKQKMGFREATISLSGLSGGGKRRLLNNHQGAEAPLSGREHFTEFVAFLSDFESNNTKTEGPFSRDPSLSEFLVFRSMQDSATDEAWLVTIEHLELVRDTEQARTIRSFNLQLVTDGLFSEFALPLPLSPLQQTQASQDAYQSLNLAGDSAASPEGLTTAAPGEFERLDTLAASLPARLSAMQAPLEAFSRMCLSAKEAAGLVKSTLRLPSIAANALSDAAGETLEVLEAFVDALPEGALRKEAQAVFLKAYASITQVYAKALAALGWAGERRRPQGLSANPLPSFPRYQSAHGQPVMMACLGPDESLPAFAARLLGAPERCTEILALNGMASPFHSPDGVPLAAGMMLRVPAPDGLSAPLSRELFGVDLRLNDQKELVLQGSTDVALVRGRANVEQALRRRLLAVQGDSLVFPQWGLPAFVGTTALADTAATIATETRSQLRRDNRVRGIDSLQVEHEGGRFEAFFNVRLADGDTVEVVRPFVS